LIESFGAGTAVIVNGVNNIEYLGTNYKIAVDETLNIGRISHRIRQKVLDIQEGRAVDKYGWITRVK
jgi:branched-chain amino acid aminotransferase